MTRCKYNRAIERPAIGSYYPYCFMVINFYRFYFCLEMNLASRVNNSLTNLFYHSRQTVCPYMRMSVDQYIFLSAMVMEYIEYLFHRSSLFAPCIQFTIGICACTAFPEAIIRFRVNNSFSIDCHHVSTAAVNILSTFQDNRLKTTFNKL